MFSSKLKALFAKSGRTYKDFTDSKNRNSQTLTNKLMRNNLKVSDLVEISEYLNLNVALIDKDGNTIETFETNDFI